MPRSVIVDISKKNHNETMLDGWFIAGIYTSEGKQISYYLPIDKWDTPHSGVFEKAPEWDGHTPEDVVERLLKI